jgi:hypothetical protein
MPRFVLLYHDCPSSYVRPSHWDLMLDCGEALRTWALEELPHAWQAAHARTAAKRAICSSLAAENAVVAIQLGDHRREYLQLEGLLSANRGTVIRVAEGDYRSEIESPDCWRINFAGDDVSGDVTLTRLDSEGSRWTLECVRNG